MRALIGLIAFVAAPAGFAPVEAQEVGALPRVIMQPTTWTLFFFADPDDRSE